MASISFPFGLKREAEIYCTASKVGLSTEPNAPSAINGWQIILPKLIFARHQCKKY